MQTNIKTFVENIKLEYGVNCGVADMNKDMFHVELREACECNTCGGFGLCYTCPPFIGSPDECIEKVSSYKKIIAFSKIYFLEDSYDYEGMVNGQKEFKIVMKEVGQQAKDTFQNPLILGAGGCIICEKCGAIVGEACRFPHLAISSLEAHCIQVSQFAETCGLKYINGQNTVTYFGGIFLK